MTNTQIGAGASIVIVDDDEDIRALMMAVLTHDGFSVRCASHAAEALSLIREQKPRLMIVDLRMPEITGEKLCRIIKEDAALKDIFLFVLSAKDDLKTKLECLSIGVEEYLVKPIHSLELSARISHFLQFADRLSVARSATEETRYLGTAGSDRETIAESDENHYGIYRVEKVSGSGGMGSVLKGYDQTLERPVAIKILAPHLSGSAEFVERFRREAKVVATLSHPGIASIYSFGEQDGKHYFAMEWCAGGSVADLINAQKRLEPMRALDIMIQCAHALAAASKKGIVHRDIKPSNLMLDENQQVKLVDFGLAIIDKGQQGLTGDGRFLGTPHYVSPEQAQALPVDFRADIYSLGITLFQMVYGELPFSGDTPVKTILKHVQEALPPNPDESVPVGLYDIISKMTKKKPEQRYQDYGLLIQDLENVRTDLLRRRQFRIPHATGLSTRPQLEQGNIFDLLTKIYESGSSGMIVVTWNAIRKTFLVRRQTILLFESNHEQENVWARMAQRHVTESEIVPEGGLENTLNRLMLAPSFLLSEFKKAYHELLKTALMEVFVWPSCRAEFFGGKVEEDAFCEVPIRDVLVEAARSSMDEQVVRSRVPAGSQIGPVQGLETLMATLPLKPEESFLLSRLDQPNITLEDLQMMTALPESQVVRMVFLLEGLGAIRLKKKPQKQRVARSIPAAPPPAVQGLARGRVETTAQDPKIQSAYPIQAAEDFYLLARQKWESGDYWQAANHARKAIESNPRIAKYHFLEGMALQKHPRFQKDAEGSFRAAVELEPWNPDYYLGLAEFYWQLRLPTRAEHECRKALEITPDHAGALRLAQEIKNRKG